MRRNKHVEVLPLSTGCLGACTYCKTKHARGELGSYALSELVARFKDSVQVRSCCHVRPVYNLENRSLFLGILPFVGCISPSPMLELGRDGMVLYHVLARDLLGLVRVPFW